MSRSEVIRSVAWLQRVSCCLARLRGSSDHSPLAETIARSLAPTFSRSRRATRLLPGYPTPPDAQLKCAQPLPSHGEVQGQIEDQESEREAMAAAMASNPHEVEESDGPGDWHVCAQLASSWIQEVMRLGPRVRRWKASGRTVGSQKWIEMACKEEMEQVSEASDPHDTPLLSNLVVSRELFRCLKAREERQRRAIEGRISLRVM